MIPVIPKKEGYVYLDYQATTPCDPRVVEAALPFLVEQFGNPHFRNHTAPRCFQNLPCY